MVRSPTGLVIVPKPGGNRCGSGMASIEGDEFANCEDSMACVLQAEEHGEVLRAHFEIGALVTAFQHRPEGLQPVRAGLLLDVFADALYWNSLGTGSK